MAMPVRATKTNFKVLGIFEGEAMDTTITNLNGLDITGEVMEVVFSSEEYATGIKNGWYIGFLGHPEDPNCMDFKDACIVMVEGYIDEKTGKVYGKFNLVDTPVGRIVKAFIDAGVKFGISIRGAGDIEENSVDPETFVFRGFDLVSFPAYPDSVPEFTEIAASTDATVRAKYKKVCAAVQRNIDGVMSSQAIDILQSQFAPQSKEYRMLGNKRAAIESAESVNLDNDKVTAMTELYLEALNANSVLASENESLKRRLSAETVSASKRIDKMRRIVGGQIKDLSINRDELADANEALIQSSTELTQANAELNRQLRDLRRQVRNNDGVMSAAQLEARDLRVENKRLSDENKVLGSKIEESENQNLIYKRKIESQKREEIRKDEIIAGLQADLDETVTGASALEGQASNLGERFRDQKNELIASQRLVREYQKAYASLYSAAAGESSNLPSLSITATTSVSELKKMISGSRSLANMSNVFVEPHPIDIAGDEGDDNEIISL